MTLVSYNQPKLPPKSQHENKNKAKRLVKEAPPVSVAILAPLDTTTIYYNRFNEIHVIYNNNEPRYKRCCPRTCKTRWTVPQMTAGIKTNDSKQNLTQRAKAVDKYGVQQQLQTTIQLCECEYKYKYNNNKIAATKTISRKLTKESVQQQM